MVNLHQPYKSTFCVYVLGHGCDVFYISIQYTEMLLFLYPPFSLTPLPSTYFILIQCQGHWSKAICSLTSSKFSFCQALFQCLLLICHDLRTTLFLSPWTMQLCRLSSAKPCVTLWLLFLLSLLIATPSPSPVSHPLPESCEFYDCSYSEPSLLDRG